jgi:spore germination cell wall hydrolase CwlJ-like protein
MNKIEKIAKISIYIIGFLLFFTVLYFGIDKNFRYLIMKNDSRPEITSLKENLKQLDCLTRNIYWEAATEPVEGKIAVAQVTLNRVNDGRFGNTVCSVVHQKTRVAQRVVCQFSWVCENKHKVQPIAPAHYKESEDIAKKVLFENFRLPSLDDALFYHADYVNPRWNKKRIVKIGRHIFYKERMK